MSVEVMQTYVAQVGYVLTGMIVCVVLLMYVVFMELRPAVQKMTSEKEGFGNPRLQQITQSGIGTNSASVYGDDSLMRGGRDGFLGYSEPPVFYDIGDLAAIRKQQMQGASSDVQFTEFTDEEYEKMKQDALERARERAEKERLRRGGVAKEEFSRYEKINEGMKSDEDLLAMQ